MQNLHVSSVWPDRSKQAKVFRRLALLLCGSGTSCHLLGYCNYIALAAGSVRTMCELYSGGLVGSDMHSSP